MLPCGEFVANAHWLAESAASALYHWWVSQQQPTQTLVTLEPSLTQMAGFCIARLKYFLGTFCVPYRCPCSTFLLPLKYPTRGVVLLPLPFCYLWLSLSSFTFLICTAAPLYVHNVCTQYNILCTYYVYTYWIVYSGIGVKGRLVRAYTHSVFYSAMYN